MAPEISLSQGPRAPLDADSLGAEALLQSGLAALYLAAGKLGLALAMVNASVSAVWPPTGIGMASVLLFGSRVWPAILLGAFLVNVTTAGGPMLAFFIAVGNTLESLVGGALVERFASGRRVFERPLDILKYSVLAGLAAPAVSATCGAASLTLAGLAPPAGFGAIWLTWWLGDAGGALVVAPALVLWGANHAPGRVLGGRLELLGAAAALALLGAAAFGGLLPGAAGRLPLDFFCLPVLLWTAFRFGSRETAAAVALLSGMAVWGTLRGHGPFASAAPNASLLLLQLFLAKTSLIALVVAAVVAERWAAQEALRREHGELEAKVAERTADLKHANAELGLFAAMVAHELQEPLRKIQMFGDLLNASEASPGEAAEFTGRMQGAARRMGRLISDILSLSRVAIDAKPQERVELATVLAEVAEDYAVALEDVGGRLEVGPLPAVRADASQMRQLFGNLFSNAAKFRRPGVPLCIVVSGHSARRGFAEVSVTDNGIGFDERYALKIFEPFQRLHRRTEFEGSGMGLAVCARIAARHGGAITARGTPGEGSVFTVSLPA